MSNALSKELAWTVEVLGDGENRKELNAELADGA